MMDRARGPMKGMVGVERKFKFLSIKIFFLNIYYIISIACNYFSLGNFPTIPNTFAQPGSYSIRGVTYY